MELFSGQSFLLFYDKAKGALSVDINSINYTTRKSVSSAKKYLKTLKTRKH